MTHAQPGPAKRPTGRIPAENGAFVSTVIERVVRLRGMLMRVVLIVVLSLAATSVTAIAGAGLSTTIQVKAVVLARTELKVLKQPQNVVVTEADVRRGFLQVDGATMVEVKSNCPAGCLLSFSGHDHPFREISVSVMGRDVVLRRDGGLVMLPVKGKSVVTLGYRFVLAPDTAPGSYAWPFALAVSPL